MSDMMLVKEAAKLWNLTERSVSSLCREGRIEGVKNRVIPGLFRSMPKNRPITV